MNSGNDYDSAVAAWFSSDAPIDDTGDFGFARAGVDPEVITRIREWVRERFKLSDDATIMVSEITCNLPGCPPLETVVAFWENETRHHFKIFKPVAEVTSDNLPFAWMKESLIVPEGFGCECC
jgi:nitrate reductase delta subunit